MVHIPISTINSNILENYTINYSYQCSKRYLKRFSLFYYYIANIFTWDIKNINKLETYEIIWMFQIIQDEKLIIHFLLLIVAFKIMTQEKSPNFYLHMVQEGSPKNKT